MLTQNTLTLERKLRLRWLVALSSIPLLGVLTAFGIAPQEAGIPVIRKMVVEEIPLVPESLVASAPQGEAGISTFWRNINVQRGDTVDELLRRMNVEDASASEFLRRDKAAESFRQLGNGRGIQAETDAEGKLLALRYPGSDGQQMAVEKTPEGFRVTALPAQLETRTFIRTGEIKSSLYAATDEAGLPDAAANQMAEIFGGDIDFHRDLRKGDKFTVIYEMTYSNGEPVRTGRIQAAEFINQGKSYRVVFYQADEKHSDYYTPQGKSVRKAFLRSPLEFSRVSSGFSLSRLHPVLGTWRAHKGVDYSAPAGTKVRSTADGVVSFVGKQGGYGNAVVINHQGRYTTVYGHLSRFASGLRRGQKVSQGEVIGHVGSTGLANGPHLHYEFKVYGQHRDPLRVALPDAAPIVNIQKAAFLEATSGLVERLGMLRNINLANLD